MHGKEIDSAVWCHFEAAGRVLFIARRWQLEFLPFQLFIKYFNSQSPVSGKNFCRNGLRACDYPFRIESK